jgi:hypothetical protein
MLWKSTPPSAVRRSSAAPRWISAIRFLLLVGQLQLRGDLAARHGHRALLLQLQLAEAFLLRGIQNGGHGLALELLRPGHHLLALFRAHLPGVAAAALEQLLHRPADFLLLGVDLGRLLGRHLQLTLHLGHAEHLQPAAGPHHPAAATAAAAELRPGHRGGAERQDEQRQQQPS